MVYSPSPCRWNLVLPTFTNPQSPCPQVSIRVSIYPPLPSIHFPPSPPGWPPSGCVLADILCRFSYRWVPPHRLSPLQLPAHVLFHSNSRLPLCWRRVWRLRQPPPPLSRSNHLDLQASWKKYRRSFFCGAPSIRGLSRFFPWS